MTERLQAMSCGAHPQLAPIACKPAPESIVFRRPRRIPGHDSPAHRAQSETTTRQKRAVLICSSRSLRRLSSFEAITPRRREIRRHTTRPRGVFPIFKGTGSTLYETPRGGMRERATLRAISSRLQRAAGCAGLRTEPSLPWELWGGPGIVGDRPFSYATRPAWSRP
jgi:hypothetical protein